MKWFLDHYGLINARTYHVQVHYFEKQEHFEKIEN